MAEIHVSLDREDAEEPVPLIEEQIDALNGTATVAFWQGLHAAIVRALQENG